MICPKCGAKGTMIFGSVYQVCREHHICRDGRIAKRYKKTPELSEEWNYVNCTNCGLHMTGHARNTYDIIDNKIVLDSEDEE